MIPGTSLCVGSTAQLGIAGTIYIGGVLTNYGTVNWTGGDIRLWSGPTVFNTPGALWNIQSDNTMYYWYAATFENQGTLCKSASAGTTAFNVYLTNSAAIQAKSGTLALNSGAVFSGGSVTFLVNKTNNYGSIYVAGAADFRKLTANVGLGTGYSASAGDSFALAKYDSAGSLTGAFGSVSLDSGATWTTQYANNAFTATITGIRPAPPTLAQPTLSTNGFKLTFPTVVGASYAVDFSTNLTTWTPVSNFVASGSVFTLMNTNIKTPPIGFYRVRLP